MGAAVQTTAAAAEPKNAVDAAQALARKIMESDPKAALELVLRATEATKAEADLQRLEYQRLSDVEIGGDGRMIFKSFAGLQRVGKMYSHSDLVPAHFRSCFEGQGESRVWVDRTPDCTIAIDLAMRCGCHPLAFMQKCYVVHGRPSIESTLAIALANRSGILDGRIKFKMKGSGDTRECTAWATIKGDDEPISETVSLEIAKSMGWWGKKDSLWPKMPELMLKYRAAMWLIRANMPEVLMGLMSFDEARDGDLGAVSSELAAAEAPKSLDGLTAKLNGSNGNGHTEPEPDPIVGIARGERLTGGGEVESTEEATESQETREEVPDWRDSPLSAHEAKLTKGIVSCLAKGKFKTLGDISEAVMASDHKALGLTPDQLIKVSDHLQDVLQQHEMATSGA